MNAFVISAREGAPRTEIRGGLHKGEREVGIDNEMDFKLAEMLKRKDAKL
jgi:hypothetical protein